MSDITVTLGAKDEGLSSSLSGLRNQADETSKGFDMSFGKIGIAAGVAGAAVKVGMMAIEAATAAASAVMAGFTDAIDLGGKLNDLSSRTGESAGNLLILQRAFENTGVGADKVGTSVNKLQKFMAEAANGGADQAATLDALGVSMSDLAGKTPTEQMGILAGKIASISDPAERARASMEVFGKSGGELLPLLNNFGKEIEGAKDQLGSMPGVMDRSAEAFDELGDNMSAISSKVMEFAAGFLESALPALNTFTKALSGVDAAGWGDATLAVVGRIADRLIGAFQDPVALISAFGTSFEVAIKTFGNAFFNTSSTVIDFLFKSFETTLPSAVLTFLGNAFVDTALTFQRYFIEGLMTISSAISELPGMEAAGNKMFASLDSVNTALGEAQLERVGKTAAAASLVKEEFDKAAGMTRVFSEDIFGAEDATKRMNSEMNAIEEKGNATRKAFLESNVAAKEVKDKTKGAAGDAESVATSFSKAEGSAKKMKEELSASAKLLEDVTKAEAKDAVDKGGKLAKKASDQMASGDFSGARSTARRIANNEAETNLRGIGANKDRRALADIAKDYGLSSKFSESSSEFRERIRAAREDGDYGQKKPQRMGEGKPSIDKPGKDGTANGKTASDSKPKSLDAIVQSILELVKKIEPKLPVAALTA